MEEKDLELANKKAGFRFKGQMRQIFGILKEKEEISEYGTQSTRSGQQEFHKSNNNTASGSRKRGHDNKDANNKRQK